MNLRYESTWLAGEVALFLLCRLVPGLVAVTADNWLRRVLRESGAGDGQLAEQKT